MLILGIDPGSRYTGFGLVRTQGSNLEAVQFGRLRASAHAPLSTRLGGLAADLEELLDGIDPGAVAIESTFLGMNPRSLMILSQARGALLGVVGRRGIDVFEYSPAEIKKTVAGNGRADKMQVGRMVCMLLSLRQEALPEDATDALAVAICCAHRRPLEALTEAASE